MTESQEAYVFDFIESYVSLAFWISQTPNVLKVHGFNLVMAFS